MSGEWDGILFGLDGTNAAGISARVDNFKIIVSDVVLLSSSNNVDLLN